ncbi:MAG: SRPBCC family protein [Janthinobacterium lividum]
MAHVYISAVIAAPIDEVWAVARDFNGHAEWHPFIAESHIEDGLPSDTVGCVRNFTLGNGGHLRERLLALSDVDHNFTYSILESPMPIRDYRASFGLKRITEGDHTLVEWSARFEVAPEDEARIVEQVGRATFAAGIAALETFLKEKRGA